MKLQAQSKPESGSSADARFGNARRWRRVLVAMLIGALLAAALAAFAPIAAPSSRELAFVIPEGTWSRRMAGESVDILPQRIVLTLGMQDVLRLENRDSVPQTFGPALLMPGQNFRLPFAKASEYQFACTAHSDGQMTVVVEAFPATPWARLRWRARRGIDSLRVTQHST